MKCEICGRGIADSVTLYRQYDANGERLPIWRCAGHQTAQVHDDIASIVGAIERDNAKT